MHEGEILDAIKGGANYLLLHPKHPGHLRDRRSTEAILEVFF